MSFPPGFCQVAIHVAEKLLQLGAVPLTFSDSSGYIYEPEVRCLTFPFARVCFLRILPHLFHCVRSSDIRKSTRLPMSLCILG